MISIAQRRRLALMRAQYAVSRETKAAVAEGGDKLRVYSNEEQDRRFQRALTRAIKFGLERHPSERLISCTGEKI